jgi:hypothetical protein
MNLPVQETEFVGGPWDGSGFTHPLMNSVLSVEGHPEGRYWYWLGPPDFKGKYYWILKRP